MAPYMHPRLFNHPWPVSTHGPPSFSWELNLAELVASPVFQAKQRPPQPLSFLDVIKASSCLEGLAQLVHEERFVCESSFSSVGPPIPRAVDMRFPASILQQVKH